MFKKLNKKGFTLAELLIVVAIIGVLVAISIPIFTAQLEKSREATDKANIRDAYAVIVADQMAPDANIATTNGTKEIAYTAAVIDGTTGAVTTPASATITLLQSQNGWQSGATDIAGKDVPDDLAKKDGKIKVSVSDTGVVTFTAGT